MKPNSVNAKKLEKRLYQNVGSAIDDYGMIVDGDHVMVCLSGGKDSYTLLDVLIGLQQRAPVRFRLTAVHLDQGQPGYPDGVLPDYLARLGIQFEVLHQDTYAVVKRVIQEGKTMCGLCSRLRRGVLYTHAARRGITKIALGHHLDDAVETLFLNLFYGGRLKTMPPKLLSDDARNIVIRPLYYCRERDIAKYSELKSFPIIPCNLCGSQENLKRMMIKRLLAEWEQNDPGRVDRIGAALRRVDLSHLADSRHFDFAGLDQVIREMHDQRFG